MVIKSISYRTVYERRVLSVLPPVLSTFLVSAWWHGLYPGYYISFVFLGFTTYAARKVCHTAILISARLILFHLVVGEVSPLASVPVSSICKDAVWHSNYIYNKYFQRLCTNGIYSHFIYCSLDYMEVSCNNPKVSAPRLPRIYWEENAEHDFTVDCMHILIIMWAIGLSSL